MSHQRVLSQAIMIGFDDGTFAPDTPITREQAISVIVRAKHIGKSGYLDDISDADVSDIAQASAWARPYINLAVQKGWLKGYEGNIVLPLNNATRAEASVMAKRVLY